MFFCPRNLPRTCPELAPESPTSPPRQPPTPPQAHARRHQDNTQGATTIRQGNTEKPTRRHNTLVSRIPPSDELSWFLQTTIVPLSQTDRLLQDAIRTLLRYRTVRSVPLPAPRAPPLEAGPSPPLLPSRPPNSVTQIGPHLLATVSVCLVALPPCGPLPPPLALSAPPPPSGLSPSHDDPARRAPTQNPPPARVRCRRGRGRGEGGE